jgi:hypothetical protein
MTKETCDDDDPQCLEQSPCPAPIQMDETAIGQEPGAPESIDNQRENNPSDLAILRSLLPSRREAKVSVVDRRRRLSRVSR